MKKTSNKPKNIPDRKTINLVLKFMTALEEGRGSKVLHEHEAPDNGLHCTCEGEQSNPECSLHQVIE